MNFLNPNAAREAALKRWSQHPKRFQTNLVTLTCSKCSKTYKTKPANVKTKYENHYCKECRKKACARPTQYKPGDCVGEKNNNSKLTEKEVIAIRFLYLEGYSFKWLSRRYKVKVNTIYEICSFRRWQHVS